MTEVLDRLAIALADRYRIERQLGAGGMATVYLAFDLKHQRQVAIKLFRAELAAMLGTTRFLSEIRVTANLQHPHILGLIDSGSYASVPGSPDDRPYYVMPFVEGETLRERLSREKQLPIADAVRLAQEVASALDYAHRHGVIHRDIKPENILLHEGQALVADFGIALAVTAAGGDRMTQTGMSIGTPQYMSPEQAMGERDIGPRSDVYALGAVTYEMLAGEPPFSGPTAQAIVARILTEEPKPLRIQRKSVPEHVETAVLTALEKLPADRWGSAKEFGEALDEGGNGAGSGKGGRAGRASSRGANAAALSTTTAALLGAALVATTALATWAWLRPAKPTPAPLARYEIRLPWFASQRLTYSGGNLAVSPDGGTIAYIGRSEQGPRSLWVRDRDALEPRPLASTDAADAPFFSPDGASIGYFVGGKLFKIATQGGPPTLLTDSSSADLPSGAWRRDGSITFVGTSFDLRSVPESGGSATTLLALTPTLTGWTFPATLPQSNAVLATACTNNCATMTVMAVNTATGAQRELVRGAARAWYVPSGHLIYVRQNGGVFAQPFDARAFTLSGSPVPVAPNVRMALGVTPEMAFSESGTLVHFESGTTQELRVARVDRTGKHAPVDPDWQGRFNFFALSSDGKRLALSIQDAGRTEIWMKQLDHGPLTRLTFEGNINYRPAWHPDGRSVGFISDRSGRSLPYVARADGSGPATLIQLADTNQIDELEWSRDGQWLVYRTGVVDGLRRIARARIASDSPAVAIDAGRFDQYMPTLSPDGRWLAYVTPESGREEVYIRPFPNTGQARWQASTGGGTSPVWARSGRELFFADGAYRMVSAAIPRGPSFQAGAPRPLFSLAGFVMPPYHQGFAVGPDDMSFYLLEDRSGADARGRYAVVTLNWLAGLNAPSRATLTPPSKTP
jgi:serine/threonine-protein kinase